MKIRIEVPMTLWYLDPIEYRDNIPRGYYYSYTTSDDIDVYYKYGLTTIAKYTRYLYWLIIRFIKRPFHIFKHKDKIKEHGFFKLWYLMTVKPPYLKP